MSQRRSISNLPEELISHVLSRLPIKVALKTSVLSRKWKYKWTSIYNIDINDGSRTFYGDNGKKTSRLVDVVTRLLLCTQNSKITSFRLTLSKEFYHGHLETWLLNVFMRGIQKLEITAHNIKGLDSPWCFTGWNSLTILELEISCTLRVPADNCFPSLIRLRLCDVKHGDIKIKSTNVPGTGRVILSFPVLERLELSNCEWVGVSSVEIQAPELTDFSSSGSRELKDYEIKVCGPKLATFELSGEGIVDNFVLNPMAVTYVCISNSLGNENSALRAHKLLSKFQNLKRVDITQTSLQALLRLKPEHVFPTFDRMKEFAVNCPSDDDKNGLGILQELPLLESLILNLWKMHNFESVEAVTPKILALLKQVKLLHFCPKESHYDLAKYLLEKANNLKKMTIELWYSVSTDRVEAIHQSLSELKPKDSSCDIVVEPIGLDALIGPWPRVMRTNESRPLFTLDKYFSPDF